jgi:hypothetical protein
MIMFFDLYREILIIFSFTDLSVFKDYFLIITVLLFKI